MFYIKQVYFMTKVPMTVKGAELLQKELDQLKKQRPEISRAIAEARAHGDLKENAEYHAAREQQGLAEARIRDIESKLSNANIIDVTKIANSGRVIFGATVHLYDLTKDKEIIYTLVGEDEANAPQGKISITAPLARALIGKNVGDVVDVVTPGGKTSYEILQVKH
jgi:transcription elongation factor GreA